jgi:hypothetical protein
MFKDKCALQDALPVKKVAAAASAAHTKLPAALIHKTPIACRRNSFVSQAFLLSYTILQDLQAMDLQPQSLQLKKITFLKGMMIHFRESILKFPTVKYGEYGLQTHAQKSSRSTIVLNEYRDSLMKMICSRGSLWCKTLCVAKAHGTGVLGMQWTAWDKETMRFAPDAACHEQQDQNTMQLQITCYC